MQLATVLAVPASPVQGRIHQPTCTHLVAVQYNSYNAVQHYKTHLHSLVGVVLVAVQLGDERGNVGGELAARQASDPSKAKRSPAPSVECLQVWESVRGGLVGFGVCWERFDMQIPPPPRGGPPLPFLPPPPRLVAQSPPPLPGYGVPDP